MTVITKVKIVMAALAWLAVAGLGFYGFALRADRDRLTAELAAAEDEAAGLAKELRLNYRALAAREIEKERLAAEKADLLNQISEVYAHDPEARAWADALCPSDVLDCLLR